MKKISIIISCLMVLCCCTRQSAQLPSNKISESTEKMDMMTYNKLCIEAEMAEIKAYLDTTSIDFTKSDDGYWYKVINQGTGAKVVGAVTIAGTVQVLGGTKFHQLTNLTLRLGKRDHTKVLDLALVGTRVGDEILIISPSSLAYGLKGISNWITSRTPVLYKVKILKTNE